MDVHQNAKNTPRGRRLMVERLADGWSSPGSSPRPLASPKTVRKWRARHALEGEAGLADRSSRPHHSPTRLGEAAEAEILALGRLRALDPRPEPIRYQSERPGELIHVDIKKPGRGSAPKSGSRPARCRVDCSRDRQFGGGPPAAECPDQRGARHQALDLQV